MGELLIEFDIDAEVEIVKVRECLLKQNCELKNEEYIKIDKILGPSFSENIAKFKEKVKALNYGDKDIMVSFKTYIGQGFQYETITNVAPINNQVTKVSLEH